MLRTMHGHIGVVLRSGVNNQEWWEAGFVVSRECGALWFPQKDIVGHLNN